MQLASPYLMHTVIIAILLTLCVSADEISRNPETQDYCLNESFKPQCLNNEVIVIESATYGRMQIGRCITAGEVEEQKRIAGDDLKIVGCAADVLSILGKKCSGKTECIFRIYDFAAEDIKPCFPGLVMYLEVSHKCINVVDDKRSCSASASKNPSHIILSSESDKNCGSKLQPWIVEAPVGQKVSLSLLEFATSRSTETGEVKESCKSRGVILDKAGRRNVSICANGVQSTTEVYQSKGNKIEIFINPLDWKTSSEESNIIMLRFEAVGCSDIIPPEDTWLKRNDDKIQIGCYSSRQTWQLNCREGKWIGVLGNCTQGFVSRDSVFGPKASSIISSEEQVLAMVAIIGCTLAICLAIICVGAVCLRRFYVRSKHNQDYKTLNFSANSARNRFLSQPTSSVVLTGNDACATDVRNAPTYSVFVGESSLDGSDSNPINSCHVAYSDVGQ